MRTGTLKAGRQHILCATYSRKRKASMSTSKRQVAANRINGQKSHGPKDTTLTRFNSKKHGLLCAGITELDDAERYYTLLDNLKREIQPVGVVETLLVESAAMDM